MDAKDKENRPICRIVQCGKFTQRCGLTRSGKPRYRSVCRYHRKLLRVNNGSEYDITDDVPGEDGVRD